MHDSTSELSLKTLTFYSGTYHFFKFHPFCVQIQEPVVFHHDKRENGRHRHSNLLHAL